MIEYNSGYRSRLLMSLMPFDRYLVFFLSIFILLAKRQKQRSILCPFVKLHGAMHSPTCCLKADSLSLPFGKIASAYTASCPGKKLLSALVSQTR